MALFKKKSIGGDTRVDLEFNRTNLKRSEMLARHYGKNHQFQVYLDHAIGLIHNCATVNAKACTAVPLRLYKATETRQDQRGFRSVANRHKAGMRNGSYGVKVANIVSSGRDMVEVESHPILDLLANPNPLYPGTMLEHQKWYSLWIGGNAYELASDDGFDPYMLSPMLSQYVSVEASIDETIERYIYGRAETVWGNFSPDEVIHYKLYPNPHSPLEGIGAAYGILPHADLMQDSLLHDISMSKNGMHPDGIWMLPEGTGDDQAKAFERQLKSKFRGARDWWKHLIFSGKVEFVSPQINEKELMNLPKQEAAAKLIRQAFGHTESMADSTDTNVASALQSYDKQYLGNTIWPALINDAAFKSQYLLPMFGLDPDEYCFAYDNPVERDEAIFADRMRLDITAGLRTINEARSEMGLPESPDEFADKLLVNGQPLGAAAAPSDPFAALFGGGSQSPVSDPAESVGDSSSDTADEAQGEPESPKNFSKCIESIVRETEAFQWTACDDCSTGTKAGAGDPILDAAFDRFGPGIQSLMADILSDAQAASLTAAFAGNPAQLDALSEQAAGMLKESMADVLIYGSDEMAADIAGDPAGPDIDPSAFKIPNDAALEFLDTYTVELADDLMGTTAEMAQRAVSTGLEQGMSINQIAEAMEGIPDNRATMIARTEVQRAVQNGKREMMKELGIEKVRWVNSPGARKSHQIIESRSPKPIDEPFVKAGETLAGDTFKTDVYAPPAGPNCKCGIKPVYD